MSSPSQFNVTAGDIGRTIVYRLDGVSSLADASQVRACVAKGDETATLTGSVTDASARTVEIECGTWLENGPTLGVWTMQTKVTFTNGDEITWPDGRDDRLVVEAEV